MHAVRLISVCLVILLVQIANAGRIFYEKCEYKGFSCAKSTKLPGKYDITFTCNNITGWVRKLSQQSSELGFYNSYCLMANLLNIEEPAIELYLWQFRAPTSITSLTVANCTTLRLNLLCTSESRNIQSFHALNITQLTLVPLQHGLALSASEMLFEDISNMDPIPPRYFQQIKRLPLTKYGCINPYKDLESVVMKNVKVESMEREAFHNLTEIKRFQFDNVTVDRVHAAAIQVFLAPQTEFEIYNSSFGVLEYLAIWVRGSKMVLQSSSVAELHSGAVNATVSNFLFSNNTVGWLHCAALSILAQNVKIIDNSFQYLATGAFQAIGPGMPENSLRNFGHLKFVYEFNNNLIENLEVRSLNPDFGAYNNVGSVITISYNAMKCTCSEIAWLGLKDGFGKQFSDLQAFHNFFLKEANKNICLDAPCILPVEAVGLMMQQNGRCDKNVTVDYLCGVYYPTSTPLPPVTKKSTTKSVHNVTSQFLYQRLRKSSSASSLNYEAYYVLKVLVLAPLLVLLMAGY